MGYSMKKYERKKEERPWKVHPVWRGIGCFMIIIMPVMAWAGAKLFLETNNIVVLPEILNKLVLINISGQGTVDTATNWFNNFTSGMGITYGQLFFTLVFLFLGYGLISILYSLLYSIIGPPRYSQFDARPMPTPRRRR